tara:strand:+ start:8028 stop:8417 length:390 start_codon:yes stop_codon:yes gene_type:complete
MGKGKPHLEFAPLDMADGWEVPPGYPEGMEQKVLTSDLDEVGKTGSRSRFLRIKSGVYSTEPFVHEHWEEVYLCEGDMIVGNDENGEGGEKFQAPTYACRPPGVYHGPFKSEGGCIMFELHYFYEPDSE